MTVNDAVRLWLDRVRISVGFSIREFYRGIEDVFGRPMDAKERSAARCELQRNGHDDRDGRVPRYRVLFGRTKKGLCPEDVWREAGGDPARRAGGNFVRVPEGSQALVAWWAEPDVDDPDTFGRPRTGMSDNEIDVRLASIKDADGCVSVGDAVCLFGLRGSRPRDKRNMARVYLRQSKRFQSLGDGKYYDTDDPLAIPATVRHALIESIIGRLKDQAEGANRRLERLQHRVALVVGEEAY